MTALDRRIKILYSWYNALNMLFNIIIFFKNILEQMLKKGMIVSNLCMIHILFISQNVQMNWNLMLGVNFVLWRKVSNVTSNMVGNVDLILDLELLVDPVIGRYCGGMCYKIEKVKRMVIVTVKEGECHLEQCIWAKVVFRYFPSEGYVVITIYFSCLFPIF